MPADGIAGVVLAGGRASRMGGGDKPLLPLGGATILTRILDVLAPQSGPLAIAANGDPGRFAAYGLPVLPDPDPPGAGGPLAGILSAMRWAGRVGATHVLTVPGDTPFLPADLAGRLAAAVGNGIAVAASGGRRHPVVALWPAGLADDLLAFLAATDRRSVATYLDRHAVAEVEFPVAVRNGEPVDPFFNVNTPDELATAERLARLMT